MKMEFTKVTGVYKAQTPKAILVACDDEEKWVPITCLGFRDRMKVDNRELVRNEEYTFSIVDWWTRKEGW